MSNFRQNIGTLSCLLVVLCGMAVIPGWWIRSPELVQIVPGLAPMQFNTALCFVLLGGAVFASTFSLRKSLSYLLAFLTLAISATAFVEGVLGSNIGLDTLFAEPFVQDRTAFPGRMSLATAAAFVFSSISYLGVISSKVKASDTFWVGGTIVTSTIASTALIEYLFGLTPQEGQGMFLGMALHTTVCHLLLSVSIITQSHLGVLGGVGKARKLFFFAPLCLGLLLSVCAWRGVLHLDREIQRNALQHDGEMRATLISIEYERSLEWLETVRLFFHGSKYVSEQEFSTFVEPILGKNSPIFAIDWSPRVPHRERSSVEAKLRSSRGNGFQSLDENRKLTSRATDEVYFPVRYSEQIIRNGGAFGFDHYSESLRQVAMDRAARLGVGQVTEPFQLTRVSPTEDLPTDLLVTVPVFENGKSFEAQSALDPSISGFIVGLIRSSDLLKRIFERIEPLGLDIQLVYLPEDGDPVLSYEHFVRGEEGEILEKFDRQDLVYEQKVSIGGTNWLFRFIPTTKYLQSHITGAPTVILFLCLLSTYFFSIYIVVVKRARERETIANQKMIQTNKALREREEWFQQLANCSPLGIFRTDHEGQCVYVNEAWSILSGASFQRALGDGWSNAIHPEDRDGVFAKWSQSTLNDQPFQAEFRFLHADGRVRWTSARSNPVRDESGKITGHVGTSFDLTERKRFEERITKLSSVQNAIIENAGYSIISTDTDGIIQTFNSTAEGALWYRSEEVVGLHTLALFHDKLEVETRASELSQKLGTEIEPGFDVLIAEAKRGLDSIHEWTYVRKDGTQFPVLLSVTAVRSGGGEITGYLGIAADITERVRLRREVATNEARLRLTTEGAGIGTWDIDLTTEAVIYSAQWCQMLGYEEEEVQPTISFFQKICHPDDMLEVREALSKERVAKGDTLRCEYRLRSKQGEWIWLLGLGKVVERGLNGDATRIVGIQLDISQLKSVQQQLADSQAQTEAFIRHAPAAVAMFDRNMNYVAHSDKWLRDYRIGEQSVIGAHHYDIFPEIGEKWKAKHQRCMKGAVESCDAELFVREDGTEQWIQWEVRPWFNAEGEIGGIAMFTDDVTESQLTMERLADAKEAAEEATQAKAAFLANMSHEIRTPLTGIIGYSEQLLDVNLAEDERGEFTQSIVRSSEHLLELVNDLLDFSKLEAGMVNVSVEKEHTFELVRVVESAFTQRAKEKNLSFGTDFQFPLPRSLMTDSLRVNQILFNLVGNAIKFTSQGGVKLVIVYDQELKELCFKIADTGIGLSEEQIPRLFEEFSQADESTTKKFGGTGLGLSISKKFAELLGGRISVQGEPGVGSTFTLHLPISAPENVELVWEAPKPITPSSSKNSSQLTGDIHGTVLLVEDGIDNRRLLTRILEKAGLDVETAENGKIGVEKALEGKFELILMDMQMPVMDGYTATQELRSQNYKLPIVGCTADNSLQARTRCLKSGCNEVLTKPFATKSLVEMLKRFVLEGSSHKEKDSEFYAESDFPELQLEFIESLSGRIAAIATAIETRDMKSVARLSHVLRGASALHGLLKLCEVATQLEKAGRAKDLQKTLSLQVRLIEVSKRTQAMKHMVEEQIASAQAGSSQTSPEESSVE